MTLYQKIENGRIKPINYDPAKYEGQVLQVKPPKKTTTEDQRAWWWGVCLPVIQKVAFPNHSLEGINEIIKLEFNPRTYVFNGERKKCGMTITSGSADRNDFRQVVERVNSWLYTNYGVELPSDDAV